MTKTRITKATLKALPTAISMEILSLRQRFGFKSFTYEEVPQGKDFYFGEGDKNTFFYRDQKVSINMVTSDTVGSNDSYAIGSTIKPLAGTTVLSVGYYAGYYLTIYNYSSPLVEA